MRVFENCSGQTVSTVWRGDADLVNSFALDWLALLRRSANNEPFYGPDWVRAYVRAFAPSGEVVLFTTIFGDHLSAVLPLVDQKTTFCGIPVRKLASASNVHSCRFDMVRSTGPEGINAVGAIWRTVRSARWDLVEMLDVPDGGSVDLLLDAAQKDGFIVGKWESIKSPIVPLAGVVDVSVIPRTSRFRKHLKARKRKVEQVLGKVRLSRFEAADPEALGRFFGVEQSGWKGKTGTAIGCAEQTRRFYLEIASAAANRGYLSLYLLEYGETLVAGHFGLTYNGRYYTPKVAYDEKYAAYGPGHLMLDAVLRDCLQRGVSEFDFLGPWMDFKAEWASDARTHSHCYIFRPNSFGRALHAAKFQIMAGLRKAVRSPIAASLRKRLGH